MNILFFYCGFLQPLHKCPRSIQNNVTLLAHQKITEDVRTTSEWSRTNLKQNNYLVESIYTVSGENYDDFSSFSSNMQHEKDNKIERTTASLLVFISVLLNISGDEVYLARMPSTCYSSFIVQTKH